MNNKEFEQFVLDNGKEILRFCRMTCADREAGDELYQDTMLKLLSKMRSLDLGQNVRSYALSVSILLWKNKKKICEQKQTDSDGKYGSAGSGRQSGGRWPVGSFAGELHSYGR